MNAKYRIVAPVVTHDEHLRGSRRDEGKVAPAYLGNFLTHANDALHPIQQRVRIATLGSEVDVLETVGPELITGITGLSLLVKPAFDSVDHCIGVRRSYAPVV